MLKFLEEDWPVLNLRKQISAVFKCSTIDIRAASEDHLIGDPTLVGSLRNSRSFQNFVNHSPGISLEH